MVLVRMVVVVVELILVWKSYWFQILYWWEGEVAMEVVLVLVMVAVVMNICIQWGW